MNTRLGLALLFALAFCIASGSAASAQQTTSLSDSQMPSVITIPAEAQPSDSFSAEAATNAYLAQIPAAARARSDAYFEGGYWLILCDFLLAVIVYWALLRLGWSARMRRFAEHLTRVRVLQNFFYWIQFMLITFVLTFPLTVYEGFFREWKYGLATQTFGPWMGDQIKGLLIAIILGGIVAVVLLQIVGWLPNTWHIWGAIVTTLFMIAAIMIAPVYLLPLFNKVTKLDDPKVTQPILSMARANGIPAHDVFEVDASRQTTRMSANVSGFGKTMRITLNDNLLRRGSPEEIQSVMGHEMGALRAPSHLQGRAFSFCRNRGVLRPAQVGTAVFLGALGDEMGCAGNYGPCRNSSGLFDRHDFLFRSHSCLKYTNEDGRG